MGQKSYCSIAFNTNIFWIVCTYYLHRSLDILIEVFMQFKYIYYNLKICSKGVWKLRFGKNSHVLTLFTFLPPSLMETFLRAQCVRNLASTKMIKTYRFSKLTYLLEAFLVIIQLKCQNLPSLTINHLQSKAMRNWISKDVPTWNIYLSQGNKIRSGWLKDL